MTSHKHDNKSEHPASSRSGVKRLAESERLATLAHAGPYIADASFPVKNVNVETRMSFWRVIYNCGQDAEHANAVAHRRSKRAGLEDSQR
jgi:hypothetical protein